MSDESQPNEVVESQTELEAMPAEPAPPEPAEAPEAVQAMDDSETAAQVDAVPEAEAGDGAPTDSTSGDAAPEDGTPAEEPASEPVPETAFEEASETAPEPAPDRVPEPEPVVMGSAGVDGAEAEVETPDSVPEPVPSTVVSIAALEASKKSSKGDSKAAAVLVQMGSFLKGRGWIAAALVAVIVIIFLLLPPISLAERISLGGGYEVLDAASSSLAHPDGLTVHRVDDAEGRLRLKLGSVPRADFVAGTVPEAYAGAVEVVPEALEPKSPLYTVDVKAKDGESGTLSVVIPNEAEPWETLDLYAWDGEAWQWLPTELDRDAEVLISAVDVLPSSVMVMQSVQSDHRVAAATDTWPVEVSVELDEVDVSGILIGTMGGTTGNANALPAAADGGSVPLAPVVRNWLPDREPNWALVSDMLMMEADRSAHVDNLVGLTLGGGYPGLVLDYRHVQVQDRRLYAEFVSELGAAFDEAGLWLAVVVDTPQQAADGSWDTGGYDWRSLGAAVDQFRVAMPLSPSAYAPGGTAESLIAWGVTQVNRHKLMPIYSTLCTNGETTMSMETVLSSLGQLKMMQTLTDSVVPGTALDFTLDDLGELKTNPETQATCLVLNDGTEYWLGTPQWLRARMDLLDQYRLKGVVLRDLFDAGNTEGLLTAVADFSEQAPSDAYSLPDVVWEVAGPDGKKAAASTKISQPKFTWSAPAITGTYSIAVSVGGLDKGSIEVQVAEPAPVITDTVAEEEDGETEGTGADPEEDDGEAESTLDAGYVSDVTVPDNTRFEQGESFVKTWRMVNAGTEDWPEDTVFVYAEGPELGDVKEIDVGAVETGENVDLSVDMVAPKEDGAYKTFWQLEVDGTPIDGGKVYLLIQVGEPPAEPEVNTPAQPPAAPQPVAAGGFELGGHIRDLGIPYKDKMHYAGMNWVKIQVHFGQGADSIINAAHANGFKIQLSAIGGAGKVVEAGFEDSYAAWVAKLAAAGADAIEIWNEPNIEREWQIGHISPQAYTNLLCTSYNAIKAANPGSAVISAAPAPTGYFGGCGPNGCDDQPWMEGLYNAGAANCMDYIGAHHNSGATSPSARIGHPANPGDSHHSWFFLPQTELYYNIFRGTRQIFYTEMGYASQEGVSTFSDQFGWARGTTNAQQAAWLAEAVQLSVNTGMVRCIIVWNIDFVRYGYDPQDGYAIIRPGGGCPACESLHNVLGTR